MIYGHYGRIEDEGVVFTINVADCCDLKQGEIEEMAWKCIEMRQRSPDKSMENVHVFIGSGEAFSMNMCDGW